MSAYAFQANKRNIHNSLTGLKELILILHEAQASTLVSYLNQHF